jgi:hypothetical protein
MAIIALGTGYEMIRRLARGGCAVMATATGTTDVVMIKVNCAPAVGVVAVIALRTGGYVISGFSGSNLAIVTVVTAAQHSAVVNARYRSEVNRIMAIFADIRALYMLRMFADSRAAVMA